MRVRRTALGGGCCAAHRSLVPRQRVPGLAKCCEESAVFQGAVDPCQAGGRVGFNTRLWVDAQQHLGNGSGATAAGHVWNVETQHR